MRNNSVKSGGIGVLGTDMVRITVGRDARFEHHHDHYQFNYKADDNDDNDEDDEGDESTDDDGNNDDDDELSRDYVVHRSLLEASSPRLAALVSSLLPQRTRSPALPLSTVCDSCCRRYKRCCVKDGNGHVMENKIMGMVGDEELASHLQNESVVKHGDEEDKKEKEECNADDDNDEAWPRIHIMHRAPDFFSVMTGFVRASPTLITLTGARARAYLQQQQQQQQHRRRQRQIRGRCQRCKCAGAFPSSSCISNDWSLWLPEESPVAFDLFVLWLYQRRAGIKRFVAEATTATETLPTSGTTAKRSGQGTLKRKDGRNRRHAMPVHYRLARLYMLAAKLGDVELQDAALDALQDVFWRRGWGMTAKFVRFLYEAPLSRVPPSETLVTTRNAACAEHCFPPHANHYSSDENPDDDDDDDDNESDVLFNLRAWAIAMLAWTLAAHHDTDPRVVLALAPTTSSRRQQYSSSSVRALRRKLPPGPQALAALLAASPDLRADYTAHIEQLMTALASSRRHTQNGRKRGFDGTDESEEYNDKNDDRSFKTLVRRKNPSCRLKSNTLRTHQRLFGFRTCSFHSHRQRVAQGGCPWEAGLVSGMAATQHLGFSSSSHPSLPLNASTFRGVVRETLKKHKRLPPQSQPAHLRLVLNALTDYLPYLFAVSAGVRDQPLNGVAIFISLKNVPLELEWRPTLSAAPATGAGRQVSRIRIHQLEHEVAFAVSTLGMVHNLAARAALRPLLATTAASPSADERLQAIQTATRALLDAASVYSYLGARLQGLQGHNGYEPTSLPLPCLDVAAPTATAMAALALAEATLLAVLKDDPYPAVVAQARNARDTEWMYKPPDLPKVRAHLFARLCLSASEHAARAHSLCAGITTSTATTSGLKLDPALLKYIEDLRRAARAKACRFFGIDSELGGQTGAGIAWLRAGLAELGVQRADDDESTKKTPFLRLKREWTDKKEDKKVDTGGQWGADGGRLEELRVLEMLETKWVKENDMMNTQLIPPIGSLLAQMPSGRDIHSVKPFAPPSLSSATLNAMRAAPDREDILTGEASSDDEADFRPPIAGAFPVTQDDHHPRAFV